MSSKISDILALKTHTDVEDVTGDIGTIESTLEDVTGDIEDINSALSNQVRSLAFYIDDVLTVDTKCMSLIAPQALTVSEIRLSVDTAPTGANLIVDVNKNGTTMYTTQTNRPTITANNTSATATDPDVTSIAIGDKISIDIDQIGSSVAGENLSVTIICTED